MINLLLLLNNENTSFNFFFSIAIVLWVLFFFLFLVFHAIIKKILLDKHLKFEINNLRIYHEDINWNYYTDNGFTTHFFENRLYKIYNRKIDFSFFKYEGTKGDYLIISKVTLTKKTIIHNREIWYLKAKKYKCLFLKPQAKFKNLIIVPIFYDINSKEESPIRYRLILQNPILSLPCKQLIVENRAFTRFIYRYGLNTRYLISGVCYLKITKSDKQKILNEEWELMIESFSRLLLLN
jgi:hypothetical protein